MEHAVFISKTENLRYVNPEYSRLYFGNEFCQNLTPSSQNLKGVKDFVLHHRMDFTLVTPFVTNKGLGILKSLFEYAIKDFPGLEIVVNDWGVLRMLRERFSYSNLVLGRLLTKQKRGPRILNLKDKVPHSMVQHFKESSIDKSIFNDFLVDCGVKRVELDNLLQGISRRNTFLKASLYFPFNYVTTSRFCLPASSKKRKIFLRSISSCNKECQRFTFKLRHKSMPVDLYLKGNTQFFKNERLPEYLEQMNIDRLVYEPEIPN